LHRRQFLDGAQYFGGVSLVYGDLPDNRRELFTDEFESRFHDVGEKQSLFMLHEGIGVSDHLKAYFFERAPTWPAGLNANQRRGMGSYGIIQRLERPQNAQA